MKTKPFVVFAVIVMFLITVFGCGWGGGDLEKYYSYKDAASLYGETVASVSAKDDYGRDFSGSESLNKKYVGIYYLMWLGEHPNEQKDIYDVNELLKTEEKRKALWDPYDKTGIAPAGEYYFWGEPLYGYYNSRDPFVIRRHIELLTMAGVDFLCMDTSNGFSYVTATRIMLTLLDEYAQAGWDVPKIMFLTHTSSYSVVSQLYNAFYANGEYDHLFFSPHGKPMIAANRDDISKINTAYPDFFDMRTSIWPINQYTQEETQNGFPWIDWNRFLTDYGGVMSVSVAQHVNLPFSDSVQFPSKYNDNRGRGYDYTENINRPEDAEKNVNFEYQWDTVLEHDPEIVHVTGWNEWAALKLLLDKSGKAMYDPGFDPDNVDKVWFIDTTNTEFSRDLEMMKGGYKDNGFVQLARNIRRRKGEGKTLATRPNTPVMTDGTAQLKEKGRTYKDFVGEVVERNFDNMSRTEKITDKSNRNDVTEVNVCHDSDFVYVTVRTAGDLIPYEDGANWMNVYIGVEGSAEPTFYDYQYILNRTPGEKASVERSLGGYNFTAAGTADCVTGKDYLMFRIPRSSLGVAGVKGAVLRVKVTDHITSPEDITDYYVSGESAPLGRLSYTYKMD